MSYEAMSDPHPLPNIIKFQDLNGSRQIAVLI